MSQIPNAGNIYSRDLYGEAGLQEMTQDQVGSNADNFYRTQFIATYTLEVQVMIANEAIFLEQTE